jgi:DNA replication protein DnaC
VGGIIGDAIPTEPDNGKPRSTYREDEELPDSADFVCYDPANRDLPCPLCDGKGVYTLDVSISDPRFGRFQRCPNHPVEDDQEMHRRLRRFGNLDGYRDKTFENFRISHLGGSYTPNNVTSLHNAKSVAESYAEHPIGWIVYEGPYGCGKTHLAVAIANARLELFGEQVVFITAPDLLDLLRATYSPESDASFDAYFERIRQVPLLVLDDLGVENPSGWAKEKLFQLLNSRHVNRLPTVVTTNTPFDDLDPRISSRMMQGEIVKHIRINAPDYRRVARTQALDMRFNDLRLYQHMRFDTFSTSSLEPEETANLKTALRMAKEWSQNPRGWLCFLGDYGSGKTHLAASIANDLSERGKDVMFSTAPDLLDYLRQAFDPQSRSRFDKRFQDILGIPILILDDLSMASATTWSQEKLFQIIDYRYLSRRPTVFTTPDTKQTMEEDAPRLATRLFDRRLCAWFDLDSVSSYIKRMKTQN